MVVSNGDGTNTSAKPIDLGISRIDLAGKAVNQTDANGNTVASQGPFVMNGKAQQVDDMWLEKSA